MLERVCQKGWLKAIYCWRVENIGVGSGWKIIVGRGMGIGQWVKATRGNMKSYVPWWVGGFKIVQGMFPKYCTVDQLFVILLTFL